MKKLSLWLLPFYLFLSLSLSFYSCCDYETEDEIANSQADLFEFTINQYTMTATVTGLKDKSYSGKIIIPSQIYMDGWYTVTDIGHSAFENCDITSIKIPNSIINIRNASFFGCDKLTFISIPKSVTSIGEEIFAYCDNLTTIHVDEENSKYDSRNNCNAIIETQTNTLIAGCKSTIIPNDITAIGDNVFWSETLTSITIPSSVINISEQAFRYCNALNYITVEYGNPMYDSRENCNAIIETETVFRSPKQPKLFRNNQV